MQTASVFRIWIRVVTSISEDDNHYTLSSLALAGASGIRAGWGIEINGRFEAERPQSSIEPPSGGRVANFVPYVWH